MEIARCKLANFSNAHLDSSHRKVEKNASSTGSRACLDSSVAKCAVIGSSCAVGIIVRCARNTALIRGCHSSHQHTRQRNGGDTGPGR